MQDSTNHRPAIRYATVLTQTLIAVTAGLLLGCSGGSSDIGGNLDLSATRLTRGVLTDNGGLTIASRPLEVQQADIWINGQMGSPADLTGGMRVTVEQRFGETTSISYDEDVKGPVDIVHPDGSFSVLGQNVQLTLGTVFDDSNPQTLRTGDVVEVSGLRDSTNTIVASYVDYQESPATSWSVRGLVHNLDELSGTFGIGDLTVDYGSARFDGLSDSALSDGLEIEVKDDSLSYEPGSFYLLASKIELYSTLSDWSDLSGTSSSISTTFTPGSRTELEIEGIITAISASDRFKLGTIDVRITTETRFRNSTQQNLSVDQRVEVEGWFDASGILLAREVDFENEDIDNDDDRQPNSGDGQNISELEIEGIVTDIDADAGILEVEGIRVTTSSRTEFEDINDLPISRSSFFAQLRLGVSVVKVKWRPFTGYDQPPHELDIES